MQVDYFAFIATGEFGLFKFGTPWNEVINVLGVPPLYEPPGEGTAVLARYGDLEFAILEEESEAVSPITKCQSSQNHLQLSKKTSQINLQQPQK